MTVLFVLMGLGAPFDLCPESPQVQACLDYLSGTRSRDIRLGLERSVVYVARFREIFRQAGVPEDLVWLCLIESGFDATATSPSGAQGMFQFKVATARAFGLVVDGGRDDRNHPLLSARACARYLVYLKQRFASWDLVLAAYNLGEGELARTMSGANAQTWQDVRHLVRLETRVFVPKIKAAAILGNRYLESPQAKRRLQAKTVQVQKGDTLFSLSRRFGMDLETLKEVNDLTHDTIYIGQILIVEPN